MQIEEGDINKNENPRVWKTWDDGYVVRAMVPSDATIVQEWYKGMGKISKADLDVCLEVYPPGPGFYVGEKDGEVVASAIRIPWGRGVYYGSYYYVAEKHRKGGYGTRLRDQVAREHVGDNILCVDAVEGKVTENNKNKFGYVHGFVTGRFEGVAKEEYGVNFSGKIVKADEVPFDSIMEYDNKHFVSQDFAPRRAFMAKWIALAQGASYLVLNGNGAVVGICCRRQCIQEENHMVGPLYADSPDIAQALLQRSCKDVVGHTISVNLWYPNQAAVEMMQQFEMHKVFDVNRMHINGDPKEFKETVFALTSIDVCGF